MTLLHDSCENAELDDTFLNHYLQYGSCFFLYFLFINYLNNLKGHLNCWAMLVAAYKLCVYTVCVYSMCCQVSIINSPLLN